MGAIHFGQGSTSWTGALTQRPGVMTPTGGWQLVQQIYARTATGWSLVRDFVPPAFSLTGTLQYVGDIIYQGLQQYRCEWTPYTDPTLLWYHYKVAILWYVDDVPQPMAAPIPQTQGFDGTHTYDAEAIVRCEIWYVNESGEGPHYLTNSRTNRGTLSNITVSREGLVSGVWTHKVTWIHNAAIYTGSGHNVNLYDSDGKFLGNAPAATPTAISTQSPPQGTSSSPGAVQLTFTYSLELRNWDGEVIGVYPASVTGYYLPPTEVPGSPSISLAGGGAVYASWSNSRNDLEVEIEWLRDGSTFNRTTLPPGTSNHTLGGWPAGANATAHVRYRNQAGPGTYSPVSNTVVV